MEKILALSIKISNTYTLDPVISLLGISPVQMKQDKVCTRFLTAVLLIIPKNGGKCPPTGGRG